MLFQRIRKLSSPDNVFQVVKNVNAAAALTIGQVVTWATATGSALSSAAAACTEVIVNPTTPRAPCGIWADSSTPAGSYGLMQIYGYHATVGAATATVDLMVIPDTSTAGRVKDTTDPFAAAGASAIGQVIIAAASNVAGIHIKLM